MSKLQSVCLRRNAYEATFAIIKRKNSAFISNRIDQHLSFDLLFEEYYKIMLISILHYNLQLYYTT